MTNGPREARASNVIHRRRVVQPVVFAVRHELRGPGGVADLPGTKAADGGGELVDARAVGREGERLDLRDQARRLLWRALEHAQKPLVEGVEGFVVREHDAAAEKNEFADGGAE